MFEKALVAKVGETEGVLLVLPRSDVLRVRGQVVHGKAFIINAFAGPILVPVAFGFGYRWDPCAKRPTCGPPAARQYAFFSRDSSTTL